MTEVKKGAERVELSKKKYENRRKTWSPRRMQSNRYEIFSEVENTLALPSNLKFVYVDDLKVKALFDW